MDNKQFLLDTFYSDLDYTTWLLDKDNIYADGYYSLLAEIEHCDIEPERDFEYFVTRLDELSALYAERFKNTSTLIAPKKRVANELAHDETGKLTQESTKLLQAAITSRVDEKILISDTGKTISFGDRWRTMLQDCGFKAIAVAKLTDFICKFIEADGWAKYFVGNIGKNNKRLIQEYHVMDKYNLKHGTSYAAMHLGGDTTKCVLLSVETGTSDGRGEPNGMTFLEVGAHTIIDRFIVGSFNRKSITEAGPEDLAELFEVN